MKRIIKSLLLLTLLVGIIVPAWGQSTTEGKEFWVALTLSAAPSSGTPTPFIAVSTKKRTTITITNPNDPSWAGVTRTAEPNSWEVFESEIPLSQWYPTSANSIDNIKPEAGKTHNYGLKVVTDEDVSVFAALWMLNSFDAANILPVHVLQSEYYTQDYPPYIKPSDGDALAMFTILATENNTQVTITPTSATQDGKAAGVPYTVSLQAGQTYYVISKTLQSLSGTHVVSNNTKIAVFQGDVFTQIPGGKAARDCTYEQAMPIDFWGTKFVVTRSKEKDANRIRVTASVDGTTLAINGDGVAMINAGQTWELEMNKIKPTQQSIEHLPDATYSVDALYLESSCPVAVYSYDVSNGYKSTPTEMDGDRGDPSMVWISPLEQRINNITFGVCGTSKTDKHYIDIVCQTASKSETTITPAPVEAVTWDPVPGNPEWSYARIHLSTVGKTGSGNRVFTLDNPKGCIAHVYGNGNDESYAYSVGSSAVELGVDINGETFLNNYVSETHFCEGTELRFDAEVGGKYDVTRVDWDFGDGITEFNSTAQISHIYPTYGWYDVHVDLYGHQVCTTEDNMLLGELNFSFYVARPDTVRHIGSDCVDEDYTGEMTVLDTVPYGCDSVVITQKYLHYNSSLDSIVNAEDSWFFKDSLYTTSTDVLDTVLNRALCDSVITYHLHIIKCLGLDIVNKPEEQKVCAGENLDIPFSYNRDGAYGDTYFCIVQHDTEGGFRLVDTTLVSVEDVREEGDRAFGFITLPVSEWKPGHYVGCILMEDVNCGGGSLTLSTALDIYVMYPRDLLVFKFNNVLAVLQNKGYDFVAYQWYRNDQKIDAALNPSAATSVFHTAEIFTPGDEYYVMLTEKDKEPVPSCTFKVPDELDDYNKPDDSPNDAPQAKKKLINSRMCVEFDGHIYDMYGQRVQ